VDDLVRHSLDLYPGMNGDYQERVREIFGYSPPAERRGSPDSPDALAKRPRQQEQPQKVDHKIALDSPSKISSVFRKSSRDVDSPPIQTVDKHISLSQLAQRNASKQTRVVPPSPSHAAESASAADDVRGSSSSVSSSLASSSSSNKLSSDQHVVFRKRSSSILRARRRRSPLLKPWFVLLYFFSPLFLLGLSHWIPWMRNVVYPAYLENRAIRTALEVPEFVQRLLHLSEAPVLKSSVYIGIFAVEVTTIAYVLFIVLSNIMVIAVLRPLIVSLSRSSVTDSMGEERFKEKNG